MSAPDNRAYHTVSPDTEVPPGVPAELSLGQAASVIGFKRGRLRYLADAGKLPTNQEGRNGWRYVRPQDLAAFAEARRLALDWTAID